MGVWELGLQGSSKICVRGWTPRASRVQGRTWCQEVSSVTVVYDGAEPVLHELLHVRAAHASTALCAGRWTYYVPMCTDGRQLLHRCPRRHRTQNMSLPQNFPAQPTFKRRDFEEKGGDIEPAHLSTNSERNAATEMSNGNSQHTGPGYRA